MAALKLSPMDPHYVSLGHAAKLFLFAPIVLLQQGSPVSSKAPASFAALDGAEDELVSPGGSRNSSPGGSRNVSMMSSMMNCSNVRSDASCAS
jgi:hypothetical protein